MMASDLSKALHCEQQPQYRPLLLNLVAEEEAKLTYRPQLWYRQF